ncbi:transcriptional regulator domain-containing protein [Paraburkholderia nemoris]|uniref:transcriptional regulator domain-containing protein n=1 Tax=Paraburkholderia nemoris TaxID=2793076 RepID=UPI001B8D40C5|nr:hypothetical protein [Paraburkholderia nemoris]
MTTPNFPVWSNVDDYGDYRQWTYRRWAWEFLRRNRKYIDACVRFNESRRGPRGGRNSAEMVAVAAQFGRWDLKHFNDPYDEKDRYWLSERVVSHGWVERKDDGRKTFDLVAGQVAIVFDVRPIVSSGPAALRAMLDQATEILTAEYRELTDPEGKLGYKGSLAKAAGVRKPRLKPETLLEKLRVYDATVHQGASIDDVAERLFAEGRPNQSSRQRAAYNSRTQAKAMVEELKCLELVPRDYV